jgi:hypothetical protein
VHRIVVVNPIRRWFRSARICGETKPFVWLKEPFESIQGTALEAGDERSGSLTRG